LMDTYSDEELRGMSAGQRASLLFCRVEDMSRKDTQSFAQSLIPPGEVCTSNGCRSVRFCGGAQSGMRCRCSRGGGDRGGRVERSCRGGHTDSESVAQQMASSHISLQDAQASMSQVRHEQQSLMRAQGWVPPAQMGVYSGGWLGTFERVWDATKIVAGMSVPADPVQPAYFPPRSESFCGTVPPTCLTTPQMLTVILLCSGCPAAAVRSTATTADHSGRHGTRPATHSTHR